VIPPVKVGIFFWVRTVADGNSIHINTLLKYYSKECIHDIITASSFKNLIVIAIFYVTYLFCTTEHVRCLYCESEGAKIVHPASVKFHGRDTEFEDLISGRGDYKNDWLNSRSECAFERIYGLEEDFMYCDVKCIC
jgi:hypothetical protein